MSGTIQLHPSIDHGIKAGAASTMALPAEAF